MNKSHLAFQVTLPVLDGYSAKVKKINAERSKEDIFNDVKAVMDSL